MLPQLGPSPPALWVLAKRHAGATGPGPWPATGEANLGLLGPAQVLPETPSLAELMVVTRAVDLVVVDMALAQRDVLA